MVSGIAARGRPPVCPWNPRPQHPQAAEGAEHPAPVSCRRVAAFLGLTFAVSWGGNLLFWQTGAYQDRPSVLVLLTWQMWIPAASAIALQLFVFQGSPLRRPTLPGAALWFYRAFLWSTAVLTPSDFG